MTTKQTTDIIRHGSFGPIVQTADGWRMATQHDLDTLLVGDDLDADEEESIPDDG